MLRRAKPGLYGKPTSSLQHQPFYPCLFRERAGVTASVTLIVTEAA